MGGTFSTYGEMRNAYKIFVGKWRRPVGRLWRRWDDNIEMDRRKSGMEVWINFIWLRMGTGSGLL
jgi:hypothetical protein